MRKTEQPQPSRNPASPVEIALIAALLTVVIIGALTALASALETAFSNASVNDINAENVKKDPPVP